MQATLFDKGVTVYKDAFPFGGKTFDKAKDGERLSGQLKRVYDVMSDGRWHSLRRIATLAKPCSEASASARIRDLRKKKFGAFTIEAQRANEAGLWVYRLIK